MNLFDKLPAGFFNCLASGSCNRVYSDCLLLIYHEYDREITYRIDRNRVRDAVAVYLLENHVRSLGDDGEEDGSCSQMANAVIRRFCSKEEPTDWDCRLFAQKCWTVRFVKRISLTLLIW